MTDRRYTAARCERTVRKGDRTAFGRSVPSYLFDNNNDDDNNDNNNNNNNNNSNNNNSNNNNKQSD